MCAAPLSYQKTSPSVPAGPLTEGLSPTFTQQISTCANQLTLLHTSLARALPDTRKLTLKFRHIHEMDPPLEVPYFGDLTRGFCKMLAASTFVFQKSAQKQLSGAAGATVWLMPDLNKPLVLAPEQYKLWKRKHPYPSVYTGLHQTVNVNVNVN